jgi:anti-sigma-K factor RskA
VTASRDEEFNAYEEALDLVEGADRADSIEAEHLEPVISMLQGIPREAWKAPIPPRLDMQAVTGREPIEVERAPEPRRDQARSGRSGIAGIFGSWPRLVAGGIAVAATLGVGVVLGLALGGGTGSSEFSPSERLVLSSIGEETPAGATGEVLVADTGSEPLELDVSGLRPTDQGEYYEFWLLGTEGELVSLGSFRVDDAGQTKVRLPLPVDPSDYGYFDVSIEKEDGSPGHSGKSVLRGLTKA